MLLAGGLTTPSLAGKGGDPDPESCGVGRSGAAERQAEPSRPGAGERSEELLGTCGIINNGK